MTQYRMRYGSDMEWGDWEPYEAELVQSIIQHSEVRGYKIEIEIKTNT